jgi:hypothetical protein
MRNVLGGFPSEMCWPGPDGPAGIRSRGPRPGWPLGLDGVSVAQLRDQVAAGLTTTFASSYTAQVSLPGALSLEAIAGYGRQATGSKYVIIPSRAA